MPMTEVAVQAIELEAVVDKIPDFQAKFNKTQKRLMKEGNKIPISNQTEGGGIVRPSMRVPFRVQGGAGVFQLSADTSGSVAVWPRGTGSTYDAFVASPVRIGSVCELSNMAQQATNGKDRGLVKVKPDEMEKSLLAHENGIEGVILSDGSGTIQAIPSTATVNNGSGAAGPQYSSIVGMNTVTGFTDQQTVQVLPAVGGTARGTFTISYVDPVAQTLYSSGALPAGTTAGDILVIQGASGAAGSSIYGIKYWVSNGNSGTVGGIPKSNYPGRLSTPTINFNSQGTLTNATALRIEAIISRAQGDEFNGSDTSFYIANPAQGIALSSNFYSPGDTRTDQGNSSKVPDLARSTAQPTYGGVEVMYTNTQDPTRVDRIYPKDWWYGEFFPTRLHEWTPGNTILAVPAIGSGAGYTVYDSMQFAYETGFQLVCADPKAQFYLQNLPAPQI